MSVSGICSIVPAQQIRNQDLETRFGSDEIAKVIASTGIKSRRVFDEGTTVLDMSVVAANDLLKRLDWRSRRSRAADLCDTKPGLSASRKRNPTPTQARAPKELHRV